MTNRYHREVIKELSALGLTDFDRQQGTKHTRLYYTYNGQRDFTTLSNTPRRSGDVKAAVGTVRRTLGLTRKEEKPMETEDQVYVEAKPPVPQEQPPTETENARGVIAYYASNKVMEFRFPRALNCFRDGQLVDVTRLSHDSWQFKPGSRSRVRARSTQYEVRAGGNAIAGDLPYFMSTPAECVIIDGVLVMQLLATPVAKAEPPKKDMRAVAKEKAAPAPAPRYKYTYAYLRTILDQIRDIEEQTPFRLERIDGAPKFKAIVE